MSATATTWQEYMRHGWRKRMRYAGLALFAFFLYGSFRLLPLDAASATGGWIMRRVGPRLAQDQIARANLEAAFPEETVQRRDAIRLGMWENLGRVIAEYAHLRHMDDRIEVEGAEYYARAAKSGKPAIFFGGHIANWETSHVGARKSGCSLHLVYRKPNNPLVDGLLRHARNSGAAGHIAKGHAGARQIISLLKKNQCIGMLIDQKQNEGIALNFFGREAMTADAIAHFALRFDCPLYPVRPIRVKGAHFQQIVYPPLAITKTGDKDEDVRRIMADINALLESWIREYPEQWLWIHNRWPKE